jgi:3',5'-cyclic AMP phosphodiesterase CpdA
MATRNPLYVMGHYNCPNDAHLGTTNTSSTAPAALMSDALTFLSANWNDALGSGNYTTRDAVDMTINAAILTGNVPSTGATTSTFSGGAAKLFRLLEDWLNTPGGWRALTLNTSFVCLFPSNQATNQMRLAGNFNLPNSPYYDPPIRQYSFDLRFRSLTTLPPGTPVVGVAGP